MLCISCSASPSSPSPPSPHTNHSSSLLPSLLPCIAIKYLRRQLKSGKGKAFKPEDIVDIDEEMGERRLSKSSKSKSGRGRRLSGKSSSKSGKGRRLSKSSSKSGKGRRLSKSGSSKSGKARDL